MRHRKKVKKLCRPADHRRAMLRNMVTSLFAHHTITTTVAKAKAARQVAERLIRYAISGTLADKRRIITYLRDRRVAHDLIRLGREKFADRPRGGYTAVYRLGPRKGDGAQMAILKLLVEPLERKRRRRRAAAEAPEVIEAVEAAPAQKPQEAPVQEAAEAQQPPAEPTAEQPEPEVAAEEPEPQAQPEEEVPEEAPEEKACGEEESEVSEGESEAQEEEKKESEGGEG